MGVVQGETAVRGWAWASGWVAWVGVGAIAGAVAALSARAAADCGYVVPDPDRAGLELLSVTVDGAPVDEAALAAYAAFDVTIEAEGYGVNLQVDERDGQPVTVEVWE